MMTKERPVIDWIPCSEELPDNVENVEYLVCTWYGAVMTMPYWDGWNLRPKSPKSNEIKSITAWALPPIAYGEEK